MNMLIGLLGQYLLMAVDIQHLLVVGLDRENTLWFGLRVTHFTHHVLLQDIQWFKIENLPTSKRDNNSKTTLGLSANKFFLIIPFMR